MNTIIASIIKELKLNDDDITNIYNYGSWVYGTNHEKSDRDFLFVMKTSDENEQEHLEFQEDFDYFHTFRLKRLAKYDITIHSCENFEILLEKNYMLAVECVFYPEEFILRNQIDYKTIYLSKYYNPLRLKQVTFYENQDSLKFIIDNEDEDAFQEKFPVEPNMDQFVCEAIHTTTISEDRLLKYLFHGVRFLDIGEQLIRTKTIYNFKRASYILFELKDIFISNDRNMDFAIDYIRMKGNEYKQMLNELLPITNSINGTFKVDTTSQELITSTRIYNGNYPKILDEIHSDSSTIRVKIKSLISNQSLPANDFDKLLFWDEKSNYFEFNYKILIRSQYEMNRLRQLALSLVSNLLIISNGPTDCTVTMRLFKMGKISAYQESAYVIRMLTNNCFRPVEIKSYFVVYDSNIGMDNYLKMKTHVNVKPAKTDGVIRSKYRIGSNARKAFKRSSDI